MEWRAILTWIALGVAAPGALSALLLLLLGRLWPGASRARVSVAWVLAIGLAYVVGFVAAEGVAKLKPSETSGWMAVVFIPVAMLLLSLAVVPRVPRWLAIVFLLLLASLLAWLMVPPGPSADWTKLQAAMWYAGLALAAAASAGSLAWQARRAPGPWFVLAITGLVALTGGTLYFGSFSVGLRGLSLAAALAGAFVASIFLTIRIGQAGGVALAGLAMSGLVMEAYFGGAITWIDAALIAGSCWTGWIVDLPGIQRWRPWVRGLVRITLMAAPVAVACALAGRAFMQSMDDGGAGYGP